MFAFLASACDDEAYTPEAILYAEPDVVDKLPSLKDLTDAGGEMKLPRSPLHAFAPMTPRLAPSRLTIPSLDSDDPKMHVISIKNLTTAVGPLHVSRSPSSDTVDMISQIKNFCETKRFQGFKNFILQCGNDEGCTTIMGTCVRYGKVRPFYNSPATAIQLSSISHNTCKLVSAHRSFSSLFSASPKMSSRLTLSNSSFSLASTWTH